MRKRYAVAIGLGVLALVGAGVFLQAERAPAPDPAPVVRAAPAPVPTPSPQAPAPTPLSGPLRVRGVVRDVRGRPVSGIEVSATVAQAGETLSSLPCSESAPRIPISHPLCDGTAQALLLERVEQGRGQAPVLTRTTTPEDGSFSLEGLPEGKVSLWALGAQGATAALDVDAGAEDVELVVSAGSTWSGRVVDDTGAPVASARVTLLLVMHSRYFEARTGEDGRFRMGPLPEGTYSLVASSPGLLSTLKTDIEPASAGLEAEDIVLYRPRRIVGQVLDGTQPVAGAEVREQEGERVAVTDADGRFSFESLEPGRYALDADHAGKSAFARVSLEEARPQAEVTLSLGTAAFIEGTVRDDAGHPVADAKLTLHEPIVPGVKWIPFTRSTVSGAEGRFRVGPLSARRYTFYVEAKDHLNLHEDRLVSLSGAPLDFVLERAIVVEGVLSDEAGRPVPDINMVMTPRAVEARAGEPGDAVKAPPTRRGRSASCSSDAEGRFECKVGSPGPYTLVLAPESFLAEDFPVEAPSTGLKLVLRTGGIVTGTVLDGQEAPVPEVEVTLVAGTFHGRDRELTGTSDARGRFTLQGVPPGDHPLRFVVAAGGVERRAPRPVHVEGSETVDVTLRIDLGGTLSGVVVDGAGRPLADVRVEAEAVEDPESSGRMYEPLRATTGRDGRFTLRNLAADVAYEVSAERPGYGLSPPRRGGSSEDDFDFSNGVGGPAVIVKPGARSVRITLHYLGRFTGRLAREDGTPLTSFSVNDTEVRDPAGAFTSYVEEPGPQRLLFDVPGYGYAVRSVNARPGGDVDLGVVRLKPGRPVRGRLLDAATGEPLSSVRILLSVETPDGPEFVKDALTVEDGAFALPPLEGGDFELSVRQDGYAPLLRKLDPREEVLELRLEPASRAVSGQTGHYRR